MPCQDALTSYDHETLRKCGEQGSYCHSSRPLNKQKHTFLFCCIASQSLWFPLAVVVFNHNSWCVRVIYFFFQWLPEEIQRMGFGWRACLAIPEGASQLLDTAHIVRQLFVFSAVSCLPFSFFALQTAQNPLPLCMQQAASPKS